MKKYALVTGASSGIGREMALELDRRGFNVIICARRSDRLEELKGRLKGDTVVVTADLSKTEECIALHDKVKKYNVSVLINNAGFGLLGRFDETDLDRELKMIDTNCKAVHTLTKLFLKDMEERGRGYILNVASSAGLMAGGPLMATYYATKSYVVDLSCALNEELRTVGSRVQVSVLCPGPVDTEFNDVAGCKFGVSSISPEYCAKCGINGLFRRDMIIVPKASMSLAATAGRLVPKRFLLSITGKIQKDKIN